MKDIKRCYICTKQASLRKNSGACSYCVNMLSKFRGQIRSSIYGSLKYGIKSYIWDFLPWQIDHIVPQYNFVIRSLRDENFIDCWALCNIRPLSSKENAKKHIKESQVK